MNVDTDQFDAIQARLDDLGAGQAETGLHFVQLAEALTTVLREIGPALRHTALPERQQRPGGRHRLSRSGQRAPRHCRDVR